MKSKGKADFEYILFYSIHQIQMSDKDLVELTPAP